MAVAAAVWFGIDLAGEPHFMDESAMDSQSYFADLLVEGRRDDPAWLEYPGFDSSPLPKYLIGLVRRTCGFPRPVAWRLWFANPKVQFGPPGALELARWPFAIGGALGCVAIYALGCQARDRKTGLLAAFLLMINPLYQMHARRAMADVLVEAFLLVCLAFTLWSWRRILSGRGGPAAWLATIPAGVAAGLAALAKLNGGLALVIVLAWLILTLALPGFPIRRRLVFAPAALGAAGVAFVTFVALNPFLTARPQGSLPSPVAALAKLGFWSRARMLVVHRTNVARDQKLGHPQALYGPVEQVKVAAVQGFGRFGPFGPRHPEPKASERRYEWAQDWGVLIWLPWVGAGLCWAVASGYRQWASGVPPAAWAIAVQAVVAGAVVTAYLPLAWDRYLLPIQAGSALLAAGAAAAAADRLTGAVVRILRRPETWVFVILLGSYAFFWQSRDWNSASRLMLTYSLGDRGTIIIDGLEEQTGDKAFFGGHYYSDKLPGFSLLATGPYVVAKPLLGLPDHPLNVKAFAYWPADYWVTLATSAIFTALSGVLLAGLARELDCRPRQAALVALAYGLGTPAYAYATMSYGHQVSSFALLASFALLWRTEPARRFPRSRILIAGFLAASAAVVELSLGPIAALLGLYLLVQVIGRKRPVSSLGPFLVGAIIPTLVLLGYNELAFGSPWDMGYFHHATKEFADVHNAKNPLGLRSPDWSKAGPLLWGGYRGLLFYAPVVAASVPGWFFLLARRRWDVAGFSALAVTAVFLVNLSYPEWTGGWSTGPRLLVPLLPFAMLPVAGLLAAGGRGLTLAVLALALGGGAVNLLFQGVGGRLSQDIPDPFRMAVWPLWSGAPLPPWWVGSRFTRNLCGEAFPGVIAALPTRWQWIQFLPLVVLQALVILVICRLTRDRNVTLETA